MPNVSILLSSFRHDPAWQTASGELVVRLAIRIDRDSLLEHVGEVVLAVPSRFSITPETVGFMPPLSEWVDEACVRSAVDTFYTEVVWNHVEPPRMKEGGNLVGFVFPTSGSIHHTRCFEYEVRDGQWTLLSAPSRRTGRSASQDRPAGGRPGIRVGTRPPNS